MFNLLPKQQRKIIYKEYNSRRIVLIINFLNLTGLVALALLTPSFFLVNIKHNDLQEEIKKLEIESPELKNTENLELIAAKTTKKLKLLENLPSISPLSVWGKIIENKSKNIKIKSFNYINEGSYARIYLNGVADSREALTNFSRSISSENQFKNINLPVSSLTRDKNLNFSIDFSISQSD